MATASEVRSRLLAHFADIEVVLPSFARPHPSLFRLLCSTALLGKAENVPPNLQGEVAEAILAGRPYPITLLAAAILRARRRTGSYARAGRRHQGRHQPTPARDRRREGRN